jgi:hypothetical protein
MNDSLPNRIGGPNGSRRCVELVAQDVKERHVGIVDFYCPRVAVDIEGELHGVHHFRD